MSSSKEMVSRDFVNSLSPPRPLCFKMKTSLGIVGGDEHLKPIVANVLSSLSRPVVRPGEFGCLCKISCLSLAVGPRGTNPYRKKLQIYHQCVYIYKIWAAPCRKEVGLIQAFFLFEICTAIVFNVLEALDTLPPFRSKSATNHFAS